MRGVHCHGVLLPCVTIHLLHNMTMCESHCVIVSLLHTVAMCHLHGTTKCLLHGVTKSLHHIVTVCLLRESVLAVQCHRVQATRYGKMPTARRQKVSTAHLDSMLATRRHIKPAAQGHNITTVW